MSDYNINAAFTAVENELLSSMMRNMKHHRDLEKAEGLEYAQWQAEQLQALNEYIQRNQSRFSKKYKHMDAEIEKAIRKAYQEGRMNEEINILKAVRDGYGISRPEEGIQAEFFTVNERALNALLDEVNGSIHNAQSAILRKANDEYRKVQFNAQVYFESGMSSLKQAVDMAAKNMLMAGLCCIEYKNGHTVGAAEYSEMVLRTAKTRAYLQGEASMRDEWGINTVLVHKRVRACPKCIQWVGKVYYDDVWGHIDVTDNKYPRLSDAIAGGLYHPRCQDIHTTYFEGETKLPPPLTEKEIQESVADYEYRQKVNYTKRQVNKYRRLERGSFDEVNKERYKNLRKKWQEREKVLKNVDISANSGIIKTSDKFEIHPDKINKFLLKPGAKHSQEFFNVGYSKNDYEQLFNDINSEFDVNKAVDIRKNPDGTEDFSVFMNLGIDNKKRFRTVWRKDTPNSKPRLITGHRED